MLLMTDEDDDIYYNDGWYHRNLRDVRLPRPQRPMRELTLGIFIACCVGILLWAVRKK
jgi:hypothetical protein